MPIYTSWGSVNGRQVKHWGVTVDLDKPTTGVVQNNHVEWLADEMFNSSAIDLAWESHLEECSSDYHDHCGPDERGTILIGSWIKINGEWEPDTNGEYAAICGELYTQVVWSRHTKRCAPCSPCYPGQGDLDTPNETGFLCFDLPPDLYGEK